MQVTLIFYDNYLVHFLSFIRYKCREDFANDARLIFDNCETFNEDDSPVGQAGHSMRAFFETRWSELCNT